MVSTVELGQRNAATRVRTSGRLGQVTCTVLARGDEGRLPPFRERQRLPSCNRRSRAARPSGGLHDGPGDGARAEAEDPRLDQLSGALVVDAEEIIPVGE